MPLTHLQLGTWPTTQACALTGRQTSDLSVCRLALNPLSHTSQAYFYVLISFLYIDCVSPTVLQPTGGLRTGFIQQNFLEHLLCASTVSDAMSLVFFTCPTAFISTLGSKHLGQPCHLSTLVCAAQSGYFISHPAP